MRRIQIFDHLRLVLIDKGAVSASTATNLQVALASGSGMTAVTLRRMMVEKPMKETVLQEMDNKQGRWNHLFSG